VLPRYGAARRVSFPHFLILAVLIGTCAPMSVVSPSGAAPPTITTTRPVGLPASPVAATLGQAPAGANLVLNSGAESGAPSQSGYDAVTIPGWTISSGLPTAPEYGGAPGSVVPAAFLSLGSPGPHNRGNAFFAGGAGGTAVLSQTVPLNPVVGQVTFTASGWLGGSSGYPDHASLTVAFRDRLGRLISSTGIGPVGPSQLGGKTRLIEQTAAGPVPPDAVETEFVLTLATRSMTYDTKQDSVLGYNYAFADALALSFSAPEPRPVLIPAPSTVPRFQHVFVVMMENESYSDVIGNVAQAPFINGLLSSGSELTDMYAEVHPSDPNYLALSGGSTFGVLGNPVERDRTLRIPASNIADLVESSGQTWKGYAQSANGPCDLTDHGYYYRDDLPFVYYQDIGSNPARCRAHIVPQSQMDADLHQTSTTPNFAWVDANDYFDMEQGGIPAGDQWLRNLVTLIRQSPAWHEQASLLIITWDEDHWDSQRPAQLIPTILLGSRYVRAGYASTFRYSHYSLLRTVEAAMGLGSLTPNDEYAPPLNDVFSS
jgi:hypothetical protein